MKQFIQVLLITLFTFLAGAAIAADLDQAKRDGLIGERADGYLGPVNAPASADISALVKDVNNKRRNEYQLIAKSNQLTLQQVQALAGKKAIERTSPGNWIMLNGGWQKK